MVTFWTDFYDVMQWLLVLTGIGLFVVIGFLAVTALQTKTKVMAQVKALYQPPLRSVQNIAATGKGIVQQEQVRVRHIGANVKTMAGDVKETVGSVGSAAKTVHVSEVKSALGNAKASLEFVTALMKMFRAASHQRDNA